MSWFRRRRRDEGAGREPARAPEHGVRDAVLPALTTAQAARFTAAALRAFSGAGVEAVPRGDGSLQASDGLVLNLHSIAHTAAGVPEHRWDTMLAEHARTLVAAHRMGAPGDLASVADTLYLRLFDRGDLPHDACGRPVADSMLALAAVDHPEHVQSLTAAVDLERLGGWDAAERVGLANLAKLTGDEVATLENDVLVSQGGFFNASRLLVLDAALATDFRVERPGNGVLVAVPNRHLLLAHPVEGPSCVGAMSTLIQVAQGESDGPGGLSGDVFYWRDGIVERVTRREDERTVVTATGAFGRTLAALGLLEDR